MSAQVIVQLVTPRVPRFLRIAGTLGFVRVERLTETELDAVALEWKKKLREAAEYYRREGRAEAW
jgi:hypothetical protein